MVRKSESRFRSGNGPEKARFNDMWRTAMDILQTHRGKIIPFIKCRDRSIAEIVSIQAAPA